MRNITVFVCALLVSSAVWAQFKDATTHQKAKFVTETAPTQQQAQQLGADFVSELKAKSNIELSHYLPTPHRRVDKRTTKVTGTTMSTVINIDKQGNERYQSVVQVAYTYDYRAKRR